METGLPDDLQIDLEGCIDADVPKFVMFSPFIQKSTAILLKGFRMHEVFKYIHPEPICCTRNQKRQLTTATCAVAKERRDDTLERSISCDCSLQECTGEIVCVIEVAYTSKITLFLDGMESHNPGTIVIHDIPHGLVDPNTLGGNCRFDVGSDNVRRSCQKSRLHGLPCDGIMVIQGTCDSKLLRARRTVSLGLGPRCAAIGDVVEDALVCRSDAKDSKDKRLTRRRCSSWSLHHEELHQLLVGVAAVVRVRRLPLLRCAGLRPFRHP